MEGDAVGIRLDGMKYWPRRVRPDMSSCKAKNLINEHLSTSEVMASRCGGGLFSV